MQEQSVLQDAMNQQEKELKNHLASLNKRQMEDYTEKTRLNKMSDQNKGLEMAQVAQAEDMKRRESDKAKRMDYQEQLRGDVVQRARMKELDLIQQAQQQKESQIMMKQNQQLVIAREQAYRDKFTRFDQDMQKKSDWYLANVAEPKENQKRLESQRTRLQVEITNYQSIERDQAAN